jgi:hypothetical protein
MRLALSSLEFKFVISRLNNLLGQKSSSAAAVNFSRDRSCSAGQRLFRDKSRFENGRANRNPMTDFDARFPR